MSIDRIDVIDQRVAAQVLELDLSYNKIVSLQNIEQFKSLNKLNLQYNQINTLTEFQYLKCLEHLESI
jgi:Leucine-rich repeat (LRR) protein